MLPLCRAHRQSALRMGVEIIFFLSDSLEYYILLRQENCLPIFFIFSLRKWLLSLSLCRCRCLRHTQSYTINFLPLNLFALWPGPRLFCHFHCGFHFRFDWDSNWSWWWNELYLLFTHNWERIILLMNNLRTSYNTIEYLMGKFWIQICRFRKFLLFSFIQKIYLIGKTKENFSQFSYYLSFVLLCIFMCILCIQSTEFLIYFNIILIKNE